MPLNFSKITRARHIFSTDIFVKGDLKDQLGGEGLIWLIISKLILKVQKNKKAV